MIATESPTLQISFTEFDLDNGLHVILHEDHSAPVVTISVMYHVGSKDEKEDRTGFAHFFEHLMFEGTKHIPRGQYDKYVEKAGGSLNANTSFDRTYYYEHLPSNQLELGLWLESERMLHAKIDAVGINTQRSVVKEERMQRYDNQPYGTVIEEMLKNAYRIHPYRWPVIGNMVHLDAASDGEFYAFYEKYYTPNNAVLVIAGDINTDEAQALVQKYFSEIPSGPSIDRSNIPVESPLSQEVRAVVYDNIQLPAVIHGYRIPSMHHEDIYAINLLGKLLSEGQSSRMHRELVDEKQLALAAYNFPLALEHPGLCLTYCIANTGITAEQLEEAMDLIIEEVQQGQISEHEFLKLKNQIESEQIKKWRSVSEIAHELAENYTYFRDTGRINQQLEYYNRLNSQDVIDVARKYLIKSNRVSLYFLPKE